MNKEKVFQFAHESGMFPDWLDEDAMSKGEEIFLCGKDGVQSVLNFAAMIAAAEREACAQIAADSDHIEDGRGYRDQLGDAAGTARNIEAAIRARGAK